MSPRIATTMFLAIAQVILLGRSGLAQTGPEDQLTGPSEAERKRAAELYHKGRSDYDVGEYDAAIASFKGAYQISGAALLIFNVAQAYRMKGDCPRALETYRNFVRLAPDSTLRPDADGHIRDLVVRCPPPPEAPAAQPSAPINLQAGPAPPSSASRGRGLTVGLLGSAAVLMGATAVLGVWNDGRHDRWAAEDRRLSLPPPGGDTQAAEWIGRQNRNDDLLRSIQRTSKITITTGVASLACLLAAGTLPLWY